MREAGCTDRLATLCRAYVAATSRRAKLAPAALLDSALVPGPPAPPVACDAGLTPGRSRHLEVLHRAERIPKPGALRDPGARARLLHVFLHHEVQAAELSAWAILAFSDTAVEFRAGLLRVLRDEVRHARGYARRLAALGGRYGSFPVRDWFWRRVPTCRDALQYTALMGLGFEGGNLEHAERFSGALRAAGDAESAELVEQVGREEVAHVRFAGDWFQRLGGASDAAGGPDYDAWERALPPPITPALLQGRPLAREPRRRAGLGAAFLDRLEAAGEAGTTARPSGRAESRPR